MSARGSDRGLRAAAAFFAVASATHNADHYRRGVDSVTTQLYWVGTAAMVASAAVVVIVLVRHRSAPIVAAVAGFALAAGFAAAHWLPRWSVLSDSFIQEPVSAFSKAASLIEIAGALALGIAGLRALRSSGAIEVSESELRQT